MGSSAGRGTTRSTSCPARTRPLASASVATVTPEMYGRYDSPKIAMRNAPDIPLLLGRAASTHRDGARPPLRIPHAGDEEEHAHQHCAQEPSGDDSRLRP